MRRIIGLASLGGALIATACSSSDRVVDDAFKKDLELASATSPISLQTTAGNAQVVSAIERTAPPAPRRVAPSAKVAKHKPAPRAERAPVEVETAAVSEEVEPSPLQIAEAPAEVVDPLPSPRPHPVASSGAGESGANDGMRRGSDIGSIIGVVLRGGHGGIDECDPRTDGRGRIAINNRIPVVGTFPGRIQGTFPGSGRVRGAGRVRF